MYTVNYICSPNAVGLFWESNTASTQKFGVHAYKRYILANTKALNFNTQIDNGLSIL